LRLTALPVPDLLGESDPETDQDRLCSVQVAGRKSGRFRLTNEADPCPNLVPVTQVRDALRLRQFFFATAERTVFAFGSGPTFG